MSLSVPVPLHKVLVVDPLCDQNVENVFAVEKSASIQNFYNISSTNKSSSSISWTVNCNSENTITDRVWLLDVEAVLTIPYTAKPANNSIVLRPNALSLCANSIVLQQGNTSSSIQSSQIASALQRYGFYDKYLNYSEANPDLDMTAPYVADSGVFADINEIVGGKYQSRLASSYIKSATWTGTTSLALRVRFLEPVLIPPLLSGLEQRKEGLRRISQYQLTYNFGSFNRAISAVFEDGKYIDGNVSVDFSGSNCTLSLLQAIPSPLDVGRTLSVQSLPYDEFVAFSSADTLLDMSAPTAITGTPVSFSSSVIQVSRIPEAVYIYCRPSDAFMTRVGSPHISDTFARYVENSLSVNFNGVNQFQNCSDISLYRICRQNGCNIPWSQFNCSGITSVAYSTTGAVSYDSGVGAVICLKLSKDITLDASLAPSTNSKVNMQIECRFANSLSKVRVDGSPYDVDAIPFTMFTVIHYSGVQETYASNTIATTTGALSVDDVLTAVKRNERVHYDVIDDQTYGGASFLDKVKKFLKEGKLTSALKQLKQYFSHPLTKEIGKTAKEYLRGRDESGQSQAADLIDEIGLGMSGGRKLTKSMLKQHLLR